MTLVVGGRGFIGQHICQRWGAESFDLIDGQDAHDVFALSQAMRGHLTVVHLASNADIAAATERPTIDFHNGTCLTSNVCEAARLAKVRRILYASGSGVYGHPWDGYGAFAEDDELRPASPYAASKVAGEALVSAYCHMYGMHGVAFRFANVVGARQTHGVGYDFIRKLARDPRHLEILGDGTQTKSYLDIDDAINAMDAVPECAADSFEVFNVASDDELSVNEIARLACAVMGCDGPESLPEFTYTPSWPGDVPEVRLLTTKIRDRCEWVPRKNSRDAMTSALVAMRDALHGEPTIGYAPVC